MPMLRSKEEAYTECENRSLKRNDQYRRVPRLNEESVNYQINVLEMTDYTRRGHNNVNIINKQVSFSGLVDIKKRVG